MSKKGNIDWKHLGVHPKTFDEFRKWRNARSDTRTDTAFIELLLNVYKKWSGRVEPRENNV